MGLSVKLSKSCASASLVVSPFDEANKRLKLNSRAKAKAARIEKMAEEREEGEIVDDFEDIISSDEEFSMRRRIAELEARNAELEQIASISGNCNSYGFAKEEFIELSDVDDHYPQYLPIKCSSDAKTTRHKRKNRRASRYSSTHSPEPEQPSRLKKRRRSKYSSKSRSGRNHTRLKEVSNLEPVSSSEDDLEVFPLRDKLKLAINRNQNKEKRTNLRERLDKKSVPTTKEILVAETVENGEKPAEEDSDSTEEQELRLIALKSAILKKHLERKKRNEAQKKDQAYSPSDFDAILESFAASSSPPTIEPSPSMEISPSVSPQLISDDEIPPPPPSCTKPVDMELVTSDSDRDSPLMVGFNNVWVPIDQIPPLPAEIAPISAPIPIRTIDLTADEHAAAPIDKTESDEEEEALRLLLLSKLNSPKVNKPVQPPAPPKIDDASDNDSSNEAESLRQMLLENMKTAAPAKETEIVLKEAVRRLTNANTIIVQPKPMKVVEIDEKKEDKPLIESTNEIDEKENVPSPVLTKDTIEDPPKSIETAPVPAKPVVLAKEAIPKAIHKAIPAKPNHVLVKRKPIESPVAVVPEKKPKPSRLITKIDKPQRNQIIISLRATDTESDSEGDCFSRYSAYANHCVTINNDYYHSESPYSAVMGESPIYSRSNSPMVNLQPAESSPATKSLVNDVFQSKLDAFLKNVRSNVEQKQIEQGTTAEAGVPATPVALKHLPEASQLEYRRLISRMKMLEKRKETKTSTPPAPNAQPINKPQVNSLNSNKATPELPKETEKELPTAKADLPEAKPDPPKETEAERQAKVAKQQEDLLNKYENAYTRNGNMLVQSLNQTIDLVSKAKESKIRKLKMENNLAVLRRQIAAIETKLKAENEQMAQVYKDISCTNKSIETLRDRRARLDKAAAVVGRRVRGDSYSLGKDREQEISEKSTKLSIEIDILGKINGKTIGKLLARPKAVISDAKDTTKPESTSDVGKCDLGVKKDQQSTASCSAESVVLASKEEVETTQVIAPAEDEATPQLDKEGDPRTAEKEIVDDTSEGQEKENQKVPLPTEKEAPATENSLSASVSEGSCEEKASDLEYISPFGACTAEISPTPMDPNGVLCPYDLMGHCEDKQCKYTHLPSIKTNSNTL